MTSDDFVSLVADLPLAKPPEARFPRPGRSPGRKSNAHAARHVTPAAKPAGLHRS
jgi:hypothetical protein